MPRTEIDSQVKLRRLVEQSSDIARAIDLADLLPGEGLDVLLRLIRNRAKTRRQTRAFTAAADAPCDSEGSARPSGHTGRGRHT